MYMYLYMKLLLMLAFTILKTSTLATKFIRTSSSPFICFSGYNSGTITELEKKCKRLQTQVFQMEVQKAIEQIYYMY